MKPLTTRDVQAFQAYIYRFFTHFGRSHLPWRQNYDPYRIMVSEIMLQQTQVERVVPKFVAFMASFPNLASLAVAPSSSVIRHWQGLGYNRRGLNLQRAAQAIVVHHNSQIPSLLDQLLDLPGIGPYTASAIQTFAFNLPAIVIETNIRTVFIYHFFPDGYDVPDAVLLPYIEQTLDQDQPRKWYSALMDYGTHLKQVVPNPTRKSKQYVKQSPLVGSNREVRGKILKVVTQQPVTRKQLYNEVNLERDRITTALAQLIVEGFVKNDHGIITLID